MSFATHKKFFSRYQKIIAIVYAGVTISALVLFYFLYRGNYESTIKSINLRLVEHKQTFNGLLRVRYDAVKDMQRQCRTFLNHLPHKFDKELHLIDLPQKNLYYLQSSLQDQETYGSIVGEGSLTNLTPDTWQELQMAFSLNSVMSVLKNSIKSIARLRYTSSQHFVVGFPYDSKKAQSFDPGVYKKEYYIRSLPANNKDGRVFWTDVFISSSGYDRMVTCAAPVYQGERYKGVVSIDFTLDPINQFIEQFHYDFGHLLVVNDKGTVVAGLVEPHQECCKITKLASVLPPDLSLQSFKGLSDSLLGEVGKYRVFVGETAFAPWKVIYYCRSSDLVLQTLRDIMPSLILVIVLTTIFLISADRLISREFIEPANRLVQHIANQARDQDKPYSDIKDPWKIWFDAVSAVFAENRDLVSKLENHIHQLDEQVSQRTKDLSKKNKLLEKTLKDLKRAQSQIIIQEKLAGLGALTAGIAHEIRNPLNFIINFADNSKEFSKEIVHIINLLPTETLKEKKSELIHLCQYLALNMEKINEHGKKADSIVRSMLSHARGGGEALVETDINQLINENLLLCLASFKRHGFNPTIKKDLSPNLPKVFVYTQNLGRVFLNIINNSFYVLKEKQKEKPNTYHPILLIRSRYRNNTISIHIRDNGPGITRQARKKIFNPFYTTKPTGEGTGLGLSLSYDIVVNQHHGKLLLESEAGNYTEFTIILPTDLKKVA
jgi:signal transduction histidine kinase